MFKRINLHEKMIYLFVFNQHHCNELQYIYYQMKYDIKYNLNTIFTLDIEYNLMPHWIACEYGSRMYSGFTVRDTAIMLF